MKNLITLKNHVCELANSEKFIHSKWFVEHHLLIIEKIVAELCEVYPQANALVVKSMVWVHDWGKIVTNKGVDEEEVTFSLIRDQLPLFGYDEETIEHIQKCYTEMENIRTHKSGFLLETKIISSADALAHYVGPFMSLYWYENPDFSVEKLIQSNIQKVKKDMHKVLLPEVRKAIEPRLNFILEVDPQNRPDRYFT